MNYDLATEMLNKDVIIKDQVEDLRGVFSGFKFRPNGVTKNDDLFKPFADKKYDTKSMEYGYDVRTNSEVELIGTNRDGMECNFDFDNEFTIYTLNNQTVSDFIKKYQPDVKKINPIENINSHFEQQIVSRLYKVNNFENYEEVEKLRKDGIERFYNYISDNKAKIHISTIKKNEEDKEIFKSSSTCVLNNSIFESNNKIHYAQVIKSDNLGFCEILKCNHGIKIIFYDYDAVQTYNELIDDDKKFGDIVVDEMIAKEIGILPDYEETIECTDRKNLIKTINKFISAPKETIELIAQKAKEKAEEQTNGPKM